MRNLLVTTGRPQLQALLTFCRKRKGKIGNVIVADLSRLARNIVDQSSLIASLAELGIRLRSVDEQHIDGTASGKFMAGMTGVFNQYFSDSLSERTKYSCAVVVIRSKDAHASNSTVQTKTSKCKMEPLLRPP
jgi:DNA invertase Pin-like site-specific DNA recombinase